MNSNKVIFQSTNFCFINFIYIVKQYILMCHFNIIVYLYGINIYRLLSPRLNFLSELYMDIFVCLFIVFFNVPSVNFTSPLRTKGFRSRAVLTTYGEIKPRFFFLVRKTRDIYIYCRTIGSGLLVSRIQDRHPNLPHARGTFSQ